MKHKFKDESDLQNYVLKTVFGRKRSFGDGTTLQDWLYLHPNKLATIREIRESITRLGNENPCLEFFQKIVSSELVISEELKTLENTTS